MKYKLIIDKNSEEEIIAIVHAPSSLTEQIENLVCNFSGADCIMAYRDAEIRKLTFSEIEYIWSSGFSNFIFNFTAARCFSNPDC